MKFFKTILIGFLTVIFSLSLFSNGLNLNGVGSKAVAMGGAFIGLADDFSAVYWNPAGLTQMKTSNIGIFGTDIIPTGTYSLSAYGIDTQTESKMYPSGALGYFNPISEKLVVGFLAYVPSGSGATWNGDDLKIMTAGTAYEWESMIGMFTFSPVIAYKLSDKFSIGATLNISYGMLNIKQPALGQYSEELSGTAFGATFGLMFKPSEKFSIGLSVKTPQKVSVEGDAEMSLASVYGFSTTATATREMTWPLWLGAGIAFKPNDKLTFTFDVQYTKWSELDKVEVSYDDAAWNAYFANDAEFDLRWDDTIQIRVGLEYKLNDKLALRAGYYHDPAPAPLETLNILLPSITYNSFTFGFGYSSEKMNLDFGFEYLSGADREVPLGEDYAMPGTHGMSMIVPNISLTIKF